SEGSTHEMTIRAQDSDHLEIAGTTPVSSIGAPVVNENGDVIGVVTSAGEKTIARSSAALDSLLSRISADTQAHWPATTETRATPGPTPKPRLIYAPAPAFPPQASRPGLSGTGRFRLKSGWSAAVLLTGPAHSPQLCDVRRIDLSDPRFPETRQPYHAATGKLETDTSKINRRVRVVRSIAQKSIATLVAGYRQHGCRISCAALVVGSQIDPGSIANPHIRAHAFEGQLFRSVLA